MAEKWIQKALSKPGSKGKLRSKLHVKKGMKIPAAKLAKAAHAKGALGKEARLAETLRHLKK